jgi:hypothetical protein
MSKLTAALKGQESTALSLRLDDTGDRRQFTIGRRTAEPIAIQKLDSFDGSTHESIQ